MKPWPSVRLGEVLRHRKKFIPIDDLTHYKRPRVQLHIQGIVLRDMKGTESLATNRVTTAKLKRTDFIQDKLPQERKPISGASCRGVFRENKQPAAGPIRAAG